MTKILTVIRQACSGQIRLDIMMTHMAPGSHDHTAFVVGVGGRRREVKDQRLEGRKEAALNLPISPPS